ncbi:MAG TPA: anaerobic ribonucleoside-triphosphate reductase [Burkholderiales bacterium]|nr:anaerobic ribonucleoside-triphosphate reductase [Burkholderiales bacterium]
MQVGDACGCACLFLHVQERQRCEVWTRVMGYHRPVASFNIGKQGEHRERRFFRISASAVMRCRHSGPRAATMVIWRARWRRII